MEFPERAIRVRLLVLGACLGFLGFMIGVVSAAADDNPAHWSNAQWIAWRDRQIKAILTPSLTVKGSKILTRESVVQHCVEAYRILGPMLEQPGFLDGDPERSRELGHFATFVANQSRVSYHDSQGVFTHRLGFEYTDQEYWSRWAPELKLPALLTSAEFLHDMDKPETYKNAVDLIQKQNANLSRSYKWTVLFYRSRFLRSADTATYGRMLVFVPNVELPGGAFVDKWIQFAVVTPDDVVTKETRSISMVAVHRERFGVSKSTGYLCDFMRVNEHTNALSRVIPTMLLSENPSKNCYDCHKSPVLPIHPKDQFRFDSAGRLIESIENSPTEADRLNARIAAYSMCEFKDMSSDANGPSLGPVLEFRSEDATRAALQDPAISADSVRRVLSAMNCGSCHAGPAKLNYPQAVQTNIGIQNFEQKVGLVQTYIEQGWMPPNSTLTVPERQALWKSLSQEYLDTSSPSAPSGLFVRWLQGK